MQTIQSPTKPSVIQPIQGPVLSHLNERLIPPLQRLYGLGNLSLLERPAVAIVGSRRASEQGMADAEWFSRDLSQAGLVIVSGLALGIDGAAHRGCLAVNGPTIAVLAHGLDQVYPPRHRGLADAILAANGLLLSEYPPGTPARPFQFLRRNEIIAALSLGVCLIEAAEGSGSISTALAALNQGAEVFVVPGPIHGGLYAGGHRLIRQGASLVQSPGDLLEDLGLQLPAARPRAHRGRSTGSDRTEQGRLSAPAQQEIDACQDHRAQQVLAVLSEQASPVERLADRAGLSLGDTLAGLLMLELSGRAARHPDDRWHRFRRD